MENQPHAAPTLRPWIVDTGLKPKSPLEINPRFGQDMIAIIKCLSKKSLELTGGRSPVDMEYWIKVLSAKQSENYRIYDVPGGRPPTDDELFAIREFVRLCPDFVRFHDATVTPLEPTVDAESKINQEGIENDFKYDAKMHVRSLIDNRDYAADLIDFGCGNCKLGDWWFDQNISSESCYVGFDIDDPVEQARATQNKWISDDGRLNRSLVLTSHSKRSFLHQLDMNKMEDVKEYLDIAMQKSISKRAGTVIFQHSFHYCNTFINKRKLLKIIREHPYTRGAKQIVITFDYAALACQLDAKNFLIEDNPISISQLQYNYIDGIPCSIRVKGTIAKLKIDEVIEKPELYFNKMTFARISPIDAVKDDRNPARGVSAYLKWFVAYLIEPVPLYVHESLEDIRRFDNPKVLEFIKVGPRLNDFKVSVRVKTVENITNIIDRTTTVYTPKIDGIQLDYHRAEKLFFDRFGNAYYLDTEMHQLYEQFADANRLRSFSIELLIDGKEINEISNGSKFKAVAFMNDVLYVKGKTRNAFSQVYEDIKCVAEIFDFGVKPYMIDYRTSQAALIGPNHRENRVLDREIEINEEEFTELLNDVQQGKSLDDDQLLKMSKYYTEELKPMMDKSLSDYKECKLQFLNRLNLGPHYNKVDGIVIYPYYVTSVPDAVPANPVIGYFAKANPVVDLLIRNDGDNVRCVKGPVDLIGKIIKIPDKNQELKINQLMIAQCVVLEQYPELDDPDPDLDSIKMVSSKQIVFEKFRWDKMSGSYDPYKCGSLLTNDNRYLSELHSSRNYFGVVAMYGYDYQIGMKSIREIATGKPNIVIQFLIDLLRFKYRYLGKMKVIIIEYIINLIEEVDGSVDLDRIFTGKDGDDSKTLKSMRVYNVARKVIAHLNKLGAIEIKMFRNEEYVSVTRSGIAIAHRYSIAIFDPNRDYRTILVEYLKGVVMDDNPVYEHPIDKDIISSVRRYRTKRKKVAEKIDELVNTKQRVENEEKGDEILIGGDKG